MTMAEQQSQALMIPEDVPAARPLMVATRDDEALKRDLGLATAADLRTGPTDMVLFEKAGSIAQQLLTVDLTDPAVGQTQRKMMESFGQTAERKCHKSSGMLSTPLGKMKGLDGQDSGLASSLSSLTAKVQDLNPGKYKLDPSKYGLLRRFFIRLTLMAPPLRTYLAKFQSGEMAINLIIDALESGKEKLERNNDELETEQTEMRRATFELQQAIKLGHALDKHLTNVHDSINASASEDERLKKRYVAEELLFPLRQRIEDLQQLLAVNQMGVIATEVLMKNNRELIRGVNRAIKVTTRALRIAVMLSVGLHDQQSVFAQTSAINDTTNELLVQDAAQLRTQGVAIHKQAASAMLNIEMLKRAMEDTMMAFDEISQFRQEALPKMRADIDALEELTTGADNKIREMERGKAARPMIDLAVSEAA